jgi:phosphoribosyl 1,2-cyclic phosphodiesterase
MLHNGHYPVHLKRRISGGKGHLSNRQALDLFLEHKPVFMSHLILAHLSKENNCPDLVQSLFAAHAGTTQVSVASRYQETPVYHIRKHVTAVPVHVFELPARNFVQASLF